MNRRNIWGTILTLLGSGGLLLTTVLFLNVPEESNNTKVLIILGIPSFVFFMVGINLVNKTKRSI
jgi:hypothetical protein